jgi:hypothetical protein
MFKFIIQDCFVISVLFRNFAPCAKKELTTNPTYYETLSYFAARQRNRICGYGTGV